MVFVERDKARFLNIPPRTLDLSEAAIKTLTLFTILLSVSTSYAGGGNLSCTLRAKGMPSLNLPLETLWPFKVSVPVRNGLASAVMEPKNIRYFRETSVTTEEDQKNFESEPPVASPIRYEIKLKTGSHFSAQFWVKNTVGKTDVYGPFPIPYQTSADTYPTALFDFDLTMNGIQPEPRMDGNYTWGLQLECIHERERTDP